MATFDPEQAAESLQTASSILNDWLQSLDPECVKGDYYIHRRQLEDGAYIEAAHMIQDIAIGVQPRQLLQLKVGEVVIESVRFRRSSTGVTRMNFNTLDAGSELELKRANFVEYAIGRERREELFVGYLNRVALSEVAKMLSSGGELTLLGSPQCVSPAIGHN